MTHKTLIAASLVRQIVAMQGRLKKHSLKRVKSTITLRSVMSSVFPNQDCEFLS